MIQRPNYAFIWQDALYVGVPAQDEKSELVVTAEIEMEVEIFPMMIEEGRAVIPVKLHSLVKGTFPRQVKFEFVK